MRTRSPSLWMGAFCSVVGLVALTGCQPSGVRPPEERASVECRAISAPAPAVFDAALETLFDQGYLVCLSDRRTGILGAAAPGSNMMVQPLSPNLNVYVDAGKRQIRATSTCCGRPVDRPQEIGAFYEALGRRIALTAVNPPSTGATKR